MRDRSSVLLSVKAEAHRLLGDHASQWMANPSRMLDGLAPVDLAISPDGARAVLHELRLTSVALSAAFSLSSNAPRTPKKHKKKRV